MSSNIRRLLGLRGNEPTPLYRLDTSGLTEIDPKLSQTTPDFDPFPGIAAGGFLPVDPDVKSTDAPPDTVHMLLRRILDALTTSDTADKPGFEQRVATFAGTGEEEIVIRFAGRFRHVFVTNAPADCIVYAGGGRGVKIGLVEADGVLAASLPYLISAVTLVRPAGAANDQYLILLSSEPTTISR